MNERRPIVRSLIEKRASEVIRQRRAVGKGAGAMSVHDLRVATRRLQEALDFFAPCLPKRARRRLYRRARRIRRELGGVRNADVLVDLLRRLPRRRGRALGRGLSVMKTRLEADATTLRRSRGGPGGLEVPGIGRRVRTLLGAARRASRPSLATRGRAVTAGHLATLAAARAAALTGRAQALHRLRIALKHYRYALELLDEAGFHGLPPAIARARELQETLGNLHDLDVLLERIRCMREVPDRVLVLRPLRDERRALAAAAVRVVRGFDPEAEAGALRAILNAREGP